ncbi:MAG TPA: response regulator, partial [Longimicrobiaceae bacterium]|nr:response regulator [Longimicrobiaceae bacterium]
MANVAPDLAASLRAARTPQQVQARRAAGGLPQAPEHLREARIVVADDDPGILALIKRLLTMSGYTNVFCTQQGAQVAMLCLETDADLVIADLRMPDRHGLEVIEDVRQLSSGTIPVLVLTGQDRTEAMHQALASGARDFLTKPFENAEALLRIRNLLEVRLLHRASVAAAEARYRDLVEGSTDLICRADPSGRITYANRAALSSLGQGFVGRRFVELVPRSERHEVRRFYCAQQRDRVASSVRE